MTKKTHHQKLLEGLRDSPYTFEREMYKHCSKNHSLTCDPESFAKALIANIYARLEIDNNHAHKVISDIEDEYNQYLVQSGQLKEETKK